MAKTKQIATTKVRQEGKYQVTVIVETPAGTNYRLVQAEAHKIAAKALELVSGKFAYKGCIAVQVIADTRSHVVFETMDEFDTICAMSVTRALNLGN